MVDESARWRIPSHPRRGAVGFFQDQFGLAGWQRNQLGPRNAHAHDPAMPLDELAEVEAEKRMQMGLGIARQISTGKCGHLLVVLLLAVRVNGISAVMPPQIAVERRADVKQLVKDGDQLIVETEIDKARQAEGDEIEKLAAVDEIALDLIDDAAAPAAEPAIAEPHRCHAGLQAVTSAVAGRRHSELQPRDV